MQTRRGWCVVTDAVCVLSDEIQEFSQMSDDALGLILLSMGVWAPKRRGEKKKHSQSGPCVGT